MTTIDVLKALHEEGLETSLEIAEHLGLARHDVSALLCRQAKRGRVKRNGIFHAHDRPRWGAGKPILKWTLTEKGKEALA